MSTLLTTHKLERMEYLLRCLPAHTYHHPLGTPCPFCTPQGKTPATVFVPPPQLLWTAPTVDT